MNDTEKDLAVHVAVCDQRYQQLHQMLESGKDRMAKIEYLLYGVIVAVLLGPGALAEVIKKLAGM